MRRRPPPPLLPPELLPRDFIQKHKLMLRLYWEPLCCRTPPRSWAPLTDAEWAALAPHLAAAGCTTEGPHPGRPGPDPRERLDAIFRGVTIKMPGGGRAPWRLLPEEFGNPGTISRSHRRWAQAGLWSRLLVAVAHRRASAVLRGLVHWVCCAFRRAVRVLGIPAIELARKLRLHSALPVPSIWLPHPDLSKTVLQLVKTTVEYWLERPGWHPPPGWLRCLRGLLTITGGRMTMPRHAEPL